MPEPKSFSQQLYRYLELGEIILLAALGASLLGRYFQINGHLAGLQVALSGLAGIYFLMAYRPPADAPPSGDKKGFGDLLSLTVLPKVLWIGCAVGAVGIMFYLLQLEGARQMLTIHAASGGVGLGMYFGFRPEGNTSLTQVLYRAVPLLLISVYLLTAV